MKKTPSRTRAFTLIEILVVISIIGLLASIILAIFTGAKDRANDAKKMATAKMVNTAIQMDFLNFNSVPGNYFPLGTCPAEASTRPLPANQSQPAYESTTCPSSNEAYRRSMQELIARGTYPIIPTSPDGKSYGYFNDGRADGSGAIFSARLSNNTTSTGGSGTNVGINPGGNDETLPSAANPAQPPAIPPFNYTVQVIFDRGSGVITDSVTGIAYGQPLTFVTGFPPNERSVSSCSLRSCTAAVPAGTVTLTRSTKQDKYFVGWSGPCSGRGTTCKFDGYSPTGLLDVTLIYR
jgi:prepilin-type N-terminal cleavage/methylation domain-containing protein